METHKSHLWKLEGYRCSRTDGDYLSLERGRDTTSNKTRMKYLLDTDWIINLLAGNKEAEENTQHLDPGSHQPVKYWQYASFEPYRQRDARTLSSVTATIHHVG